MSEKKEKKEKKNFRYSNHYPDLVHGTIASGDRTAYVRTTESPPQVWIEFCYPDGVLRTYKRDRTELVEASLSRMEKTLNKEKGQLPGAPVTTLSLHPHTSLPNEEAWVDGAVLTVGDVTFSVRRDVGFVNAMSPPGLLMEGLPATPGLIDVVNGVPREKYKVVIDWITGDTREVLHVGRVFVPTIAHVGKTVLVRGYCVDVTNAAVSPARVLEVPCGVVQPHYPNALPALQRFNCHNPVSPADGGLRVMSYNVLHDANCDTQYCRENLYPHIDPKLLSQHYRFPRICWEIIHTKPDIVLLQEMGSAPFERDFVPILGEADYTGVLQLKHGSEEGIAVFFRTSRFSLLDKVVVDRSSWRKMDTTIVTAVEQFNQCAAVMDKIASIGLVLRLADKLHPRRHVVVGNTHLFFNHFAPHVRLLQAYNMITECLSLTAGTTDPIVFGGDFNSPRDSSVVTLLTKGVVPKDHRDWAKGSIFTLDDLTFDPDFASKQRPATPTGVAFGLDLALPTPFVEATHDYTYSMRAPKNPDLLFDYVFVGNGLRLVQCVPPPTQEEVTPQGTPNENLSSDHISVAADVAFHV